MRVGQAREDDLALWHRAVLFLVGLQRLHEGVMHQVAADKVVHPRVVERHRTDVEEALQTLALAVAVKIEDERRWTATALAKIRLDVVAQRLEGDSGVEPSLWDRHILEGHAEAGAIFGVENLSLLDVESAADDVAFLETALTKLLAGLRLTRILDVGEDVSVAHKAVATSLAAKRFVTFLVASAEAYADRAELPLHSEDLHLVVEAEALLPEADRLVRQYSLRWLAKLTYGWLLVRIVLFVDTDTHVGVVGRPVGIISLNDDFAMGVLGRLVVLHSEVQLAVGMRHYVSPRAEDGLLRQRLGANQFLTDAFALEALTVGVIVADAASALLLLGKQLLVLELAQAVLLHVEFGNTLPAHYVLEVRWLVCWEFLFVRG